MPIRDETLFLCRPIAFILLGLSSGDIILRTVQIGAPIRILNLWRSPIGADAYGLEGIGAVIVSGVVPAHASTSGIYTIANEVWIE